LSVGGDGGSSFRSISENGFSMTDIFGSSKRCSSNDGGKGRIIVENFMILLIILKMNILFSDCF